MFITKSKKKILILTLLAFSLVALACVKRPMPVITQNINTNSAVNILNDCESNESTLKSLKNNYPQWFVQSKVISTFMHWKRDDDFTMALSEACNIGISVDSIAEQDKKILEGIKNFFKDYNFQINKKNTDDGIIQGDFYDYYQLGFEKGNEKCVIQWYYISTNYFTVDVNCADYKEIDEIYFKEFFKLFNKLDTYWSVEKFIGNYAMGNDGPSWWIAQKINGRWVKILSGQDYVSCEDLAKYKIPNSIYNKECWDKENNNLRIWENN
jgi:hypothetical protein